MAGPNKRTIQIFPGQPPTEVEVIPILSESEVWSSYSLADGTVLRVKHIAHTVYRLCNAWTVDGSPHYFLQTQPVMVADSPPDLRRPMPPEQV